VEKYGNKFVAGCLRIFGHEEKKVKKEWRKLHNEEIHDLYFLSNIGMIKSGGMSWVGHLKYRREVYIKFLFEDLKSTNHFYY
jgi:hypothetical protein